MAEEALCLPTGLRNLGYTCYLNTVLQALASCQSFITQLQDALGPSTTAGGAAPPPPPAADTAPLAAALLDCLLRLQPQPDGTSSMVSFAPRAVLGLFRSKLPPGVLEAGEEHDAAEAWECLCGLVAEELQAAFLRSGAQRQLLGRASLAAVLECRTGSSGGGAGGGGGSGGLLKASVPEAQGAPPAAGHASTSTAGWQSGPSPGAVEASSVLRAPDSTSCSRGSHAGSGGEASNRCDAAAAGATAGAASNEQLAALPAPSSAAAQAADADGAADAPDAAAGAAGPVHAADAGEALQAACAGGEAAAAVAAGAAQEAGTASIADAAGAAGTPSAAGGAGAADAANAANAARSACGAGVAWAAAAYPPADPVLSGWRALARLPLQGSNAQELQCLRCGHRSCLQLAPFLLLPLGIPTLAQHTLLGSVPAAPGADLAGCLAAFYSYEMLQGLHCTRCSLAGSLEGREAALAAAAGTCSAAQDPASASPGGSEAAEVDRAGGQAAGTAGDATDGWQDAAAGSAAPAGRHEGELLGGVAAGEEAGEAAAAQLLRVQRVLADRGSLLLETEAYRALLETAGLPWVPRPSPAVRRTVLASLPRVLCLQLRRGFWSEHGHVKVSGHVAFPLTLVLPRDKVPRLGCQREQTGARQTTADEAAAAAAAAAGSGAGSGISSGAGSGIGSAEVWAPPPRPPRFMLRAVVVHHGGLAGGGHYTVYRCLDGTAAQAASPLLGCRWLGASDEDVRPVGVREVLAAEASMLVYERC